MKKYLFIALAAAAMTSCSQDEVMEMNQEAIAFGGGFVENATRATDIGYKASNLNAFTLYGTVTNGADATKTVLLYNGENVSTTGGIVEDKVWTGYSTHYWIAGADYKFAAVVDASQINKNSIGMPETLIYNLADQKDMLYNLVTRKNNTELDEFQFNHLVSKVFFTFATTMAANSDYKYKVKDVEIYAGLATTGTYTCATNTWSIEGKATTSNSSTDDNIKFGDICGNGDTEDQNKTTCTPAYLTTEGLTSHNAKFVIPGKQNIYVRYTVELYLKDTLIKSETKTTAEAIEVTFEPNHVYNIKGELGINTPIQFSVSTLGGWDSEIQNVEVQ